MSPEVRPFRPEDAAAVAALHRLALPGGFLSRLGDRFLSALYTSLSRAPGTCVWVAADAGDRCVGFVAGSLDIRRAYGHVLRRDGFRLLATVLPSLCRPGVVKHILQTLAYPFRAKRRDAETPAGADVRAELLSIAVAAEARGHGCGRRLVDRLEATFRDWGLAGDYRVVTAAEDPRSNAFYEGVGFAPAGTFRHHENTMALYLKTLPTADDKDSPSC